MENNIAMQGGTPKGGKIKIIITSAVVLVGLAIVALTATSLMQTSNPGRSAVGQDSMTVSYSAPKSASLNFGSGMSELAVDEGSAPAPAIDKKVIKNGNVTMKVGQVEDAVKEISQISKDNGGDVFSSNFYETADKKKSGMITLKVKNDNFEKAFEEIKKVASLVVRESINSQDVTEQYVDLESRLKNAQAEEQSYLQILDRASTVDEVLKVTRQLSQVRGEIEAMQGQKKYLDSQIDMSMITVSLTEDSEITISDSWRPLRTIKETINSLLSDIKGFINFVIVLIIRIIPILVLYALLVLVAFLIGKKVYRKIKNRKAGTDIEG